MMSGGGGLTGCTMAMAMAVEGASTAVRQWVVGLGVRWSVVVWSDLGGCRSRAAHKVGMGH
jgi:hypothetical protein